MIVEILKDCKHTGIKSGQIYRAKTYEIDPSKVTLLRRLTKKDRREIGKEPMCNEYKCNVRVLDD